MFDALGGALSAFISHLFTVEMLIALLIGVVGGMIIGALPGLSATMGIALLTPISYGMSAIPALTMLTAIYTSAIMGGSFTAILVHSPGTTSSAATLIDGYPMTLKGQALKALGTSIISSTIGGIISALALLLLAPPLARVSLAFNAAEYFLLGVFGLSVIAGLSSDSLSKGLVSGCLGLVLSTVGTDALSAFPRYTFGSVNLLEGFNSTTALIGLFSLGQMLVNSEKILAGKTNEAGEKVKTKGSILLSFQELKLIMPTVLRSSAIGTAVGILPGAGGSIASFIAYNEGKRFAKDKENYGKGCIEGVAAPEAANNAVTGGAMIPLLTLGIPGSPAAAVLLGGLLIHGMVPGSGLFVGEKATITYAIIIGFLFTTLLMCPIGLIIARWMGNVVKIPQAVLTTVIIVLAVIGSYSVRQNIFDVYVMVVFGFIGYIIQKSGFLSAALVLGLLLGYTAESGLRKSLVMAKGAPVSYYFSRPACLILMALIAASLLWPPISKALRKRKEAKTAAA